MSHSNIFTHPSILVRGLVKQRKDRVLLAEIPKWRAKRWKASSVFIQPQMRQNTYVASIKSYLLSNERGFSTTFCSSDFQSGWQCCGCRGFQVPCLGFAGLISRTFNPIFMLQIEKEVLFLPLAAAIPVQNKGGWPSPNLGIVKADDREDNEGVLRVVLA